MLEVLRELPCIEEEVLHRQDEMEIITDLTRTMNPSLCAAIALANARLFAEVERQKAALEQTNQALQREIAEHQRTEELFHTVAKRVSSCTGETFLQSLVYHLADVLEIEYAFVGMLVDPEQVRTVAVCAHGQIVDNFTYGLAGTPCQKVLEQETCIYPHNVCEQFPEDGLLRDMEVESYVGTALVDSLGVPCGLLVILGSRPMHYGQRSRTLLRIFATRAAAELERGLTRAALHEAQARLLEQQQRETERVARELALTQQQLVRQTRLATIGQVAASIAHELRNSLGAVRNAAYLLQRRMPERVPRGKTYLDMIVKEVDSSERIIGDLLEMSRGKEPLKEPLILEIVLQKASSYLQEYPKIVWEYALSPESLEVWGDFVQLCQVFSNLFLNAAQAMAGQGTIRVSTMREAEYDCIFVSDNGPGVIVEQSEQFFEPLFTTKAKGTGLGLTLCRQIIERHGGTITFSESAQQGATVCVRLPH